MTYRDLQELRAYDRIDPFGEEREDMRAALIACTVATYLSGKSHRIEDFMLDFDRSTRQQSPEEMVARIKLAVQIAEKNKGKNHGKFDGSCSLTDR